MNEDMARAYAAAWSSGVAAEVAAFFAADGEIVINRGEPSRGRNEITAMADGFYSEFPDLVVHLDSFRRAGDHAVFKWTLEGHHVETKNYVKASGWEEWDLNEAGLVQASRGWFDAEDYQRQIDGG